MPKGLSAEALALYEREGFHFPVPVVSAEEAQSIRADVEVAERHFASQGERLRHRPHLLVTALDRLIRNDPLLDAVEDLLGPNILCWTSLFFTKEAQDPAFVSLHQDSTYWGLSSADVVTAWIALSPSTIESGAMRFAPGTHKLDQIAHRDTYDEHNLLTRGQVVEHDVDEAAAVDVVLRPGEASLHHVRLIHGSGPNRSDDRRIGFAIRYIPTHVHNIVGRDFAALVRGVDEHHHFDAERRPERDLEPEALAAYEAANEAHNAVLYAGAEQMRG
jgi:ectoine hydroxylase-related dioxygenase (phytanoyl-CoA dioxygenase family)